MPEQRTKSLISLRDTTKSYGNLLALNHVSFDLKPGEVVALVGKNGSGKSTLIKILAGVVQADAGVMELSGEPVRFASPSDALRAGVVTVHQELSVIPSLSVAENIVLGNWPRKAGFSKRIDLKAMEQIAVSILQELNESQIDVQALVSSLSVAERQIVEIARALVQRPKILLLDEPFSTLSAQEVAIMSRRIEAIAQAGLAVAFVTHRLGEVKSIASTVMVLRDGNLIAKERSADITVEQVAQLMLGEAAARPARQTENRPSAGFSDLTVLSVRNFTVPGKTTGIDLDIKAGEIVGIAGLLGSGRSEFLRALCGIDACTFDSFSLMGEKITKPALGDMIRRGVYFVPEERKLEGFVGAFSVMENLELPHFAQQALFNQIDWPEVRSSSQEIVDRMQVKTSNLSEPIQNLSGGNQQKVVLGKWIKRGNVRLFLLDEPSRGVDIHARLEIEAVIKELAGLGVAILMVASEFEELFNVCDRLVLVGHGKVPRSIPVNQTNLEAVTAELLN